MYPNEEECRIRKLIEEVSDEVNELGFVSDSCSDHVSASDHFTASEDDAESEITANSSDGHQVCKLMGRDGTTVVPTKNKRTSSCNIIKTHLPCVRKEFQDFKSPTACFQLFVTNIMFEIVVQNTNKYIDTVSVNYGD
jgi:hypothetical protein